MPVRRRPASRHTPLVYGDKLVLWLDGSDQGTMTPGTGIATWRDKGPFGNHAAQATGASQPTLVQGAQNGLCGVRCASQFIFGAVALSGANASIFVVGRMQSGAVSAGRVLALANTGLADTGAGGVVVRRNSANQQMQTAYNAAGVNTLGTIVYGTAFIWGNVFSTGLSSRLNGGAEVAGVGLPAITATRYCVGANLAAGAPGVTFWSDDVYEVVVIAAALTDGERQREEGRLAHKWGLQGSLPATHPWLPVRP